MPRIDYLFIFRPDGCDPAVPRTLIHTPEGDVSTVGVSTAE